MPQIAPVLLSGLTWKQAFANLLAVDCALRRPHWCSPIMILHNGVLTQDDDGEMSPFSFMSDDERAKDWMMVPRVDGDGKDIAPAYRQALQKGGSGE
ncbi:hypothetical protein ASE85_02555 [Sphingobium sp. Leaf26]|uniref:hypothetical protein n=1 Tax=Sphingobium sp. Leaf26 TaxID=1735693 RepID=UPI0006F32250|nr:hypothetical protein [Sphingobium sp. Leaf26]KQN09835.1 hypothetical protein ASE85_02555 [Sphingobium sp. Leaf26]